MKKTILSITLTLLSLLTMNAQNVKTKKNMAFLDNKPIATIIQDPVEKGDKTSRFERYYTVSDLQGNFLFKARLTKTTPQNNVHIEYWLELTNDQGTIFEYDYIAKDVSMLSGTDIKILKALVSNNIISDDHIKTSDFTGAAYRPISSKIDQLLEEIAKEHQLQDTFAAQKNFRIAKSNDILKPLFIEDTQVGKVRMGQASSSENYYEFLDMDGNVIGSCKFRYPYTGNPLKPQILTTFDNKTFEVVQEFGPSIIIGEDKFGIRLAKTLYYNGYFQ